MHHPPDCLTRQNLHFRSQLSFRIGVLRLVSQQGFLPQAAGFAWQPGLLQERPCKGSEWARTNEVLVLRCVTGTWTAFHSAVSADGLTLQCRQPVFRCLAADITQPGWHTWQTNYAASPNDAGLAVDWQGTLWAETRVP